MILRRELSAAPPVQSRGTEHLRARTGQSTRMSATSSACNRSDLHKTPADCPIGFVGASRSAVMSVVSSPSCGRRRRAGYERGRTGISEDDDCPHLPVLAKFSEIGSISAVLAEDPDEPTAPKPVVGLHWRSSSRLGQGRPRASSLETPAIASSRRVDPDDLMLETFL